MFSLIDQLQAASPHLLAAKPAPKSKVRTLTFKEQVFATLPKKNGITTHEIIKKVDIHKSTVSECLKALKAEKRAKVIGKFECYQVWVRA
jgi:DNA invertase Pin-like site-specific DNA recombinase